MPPDSVGGYTLLEVLLALALTAVVLLIVTSGITVQLRAFSAGRARVERAQLARVLLHRMADDLRGALPPTAQSGTSTTQTSTSGDATSGAETDTGGGQSSGGENAGEDESQTDSEEDSEATDSSADATVVGIYGELDLLRVDVARVPRSESSSSDGAASGSTSTSDTKRPVKTVVYYVVTADEATAGTAATESEEQPRGGLVRRELTRPTTVWAAEQGSMEYRDASVGPLAADVTGVEFRYHDGSDWVESWDTATSGSLPKAIEIRLYLAPLPTTRLGGALQPSADTTTGTDETADMQYRLVVPLTVESASGSTGGATSGGTTEGTGNATSGGTTEGTGGQTSTESSSGSTGAGNTSNGQGGSP